MGLAAAVKHRKPIKIGAKKKSEIGVRRNDEAFPAAG